MWGFSSRLPGTEIPSQATLVFNVLLVDVHNPKDNITIENQVVPESCTRRSVVGDYIRYHYNGTFLNGVTFDTRWAEIMAGLTWYFKEITLIWERFWLQDLSINFILWTATRGTAHTIPTSGWGMWSRVWTRPCWGCASERGGGSLSLHTWLTESKELVGLNKVPLH